MRALDYILLAIVAVCAVIAWRVWRRTMKKGGCCGGNCTGSCAQCGRACAHKPKKYPRHMKTNLKLLRRDAAGF